MGFIYLACPYTSPSAIEQADRVEIASAAAAEMMLEGHCVYSPITHGRHIAQHLPQSVDYDFWMKQCKPLLMSADCLVVLPLPGWRASKGVMQEISWAREFKKNVIFLQNSPKAFAHRLEPIDDGMLSYYGGFRVARGFVSRWKEIG